MTQTLQPDAVYGSDRLPNGLANLLGVRPGAAFDYEGPATPRMFSFGLSFETTYEGIAQLLLPPPLEPDMNAPPVVTVRSSVNLHSKGYDGRERPYQMLYFGAPARYKDLVGYTAFEYVDGIHGDKTVACDQLIAWGIYLGMLKKIADIRHVAQGDRVELTVDRQGTRLVTMSMRIGDELVGDARAAANPRQYSSGDVGVGMIGVREIPNADYSGYVDRSLVCASPEQVRFDRVWSADAAELSLGSLPLDPLDLLPVLEIREAFACEYAVPKERFSQVTVVPLDS